MTDEPTQDATPDAADDAAADRMAGDGLEYLRVVQPADAPPSTNEPRRGGVVGAR